MSLAEKITENMKAAMKAKDSATLSTLRLLISALKNKKIDVQHELSDAEVTDVVKSQVKQLKDSIESFKAGGREDLAASTQIEVTVLEQYLPAQMSDEELTQVVKGAVEKSGATSKADMGKVMGAAMAAVAGRADGSRVKEMVMRFLPIVVLVVCGTGVMMNPALAAIPLTGERMDTDFVSLATGLRALRVLVLWIGILGITFILFGGFNYMKASSRDDEHKSALTFITLGVFASVAVFLMFGFSTIILQSI